VTARPSFPSDRANVGYLSRGALESDMGLKKDLANGLISLVIGIAVTAYTADDEDFDRTELLLSVAVSSFLSGFFTSYFAE